MRNENNSFIKVSKLVIANILFTFLFLIISDIFLRLINDAPLQLINFINNDLNKNSLNANVRYDSLLGWVPKSNQSNKRFNTSKDGIRHTDYHSINNNTILTVGDSFTWGAEVKDNETWPYHLQKISGFNVLNGGVGAYGADQIILRAEQLYKIYKPNYVILSISEESIAQVSFMSYNGYSKPYFIDEDGQITLKNQPVPLKSEILNKNFHTTFNNIAGYFYMYSLIYKKIDPTFENYSTLKEVKNDNDFITCRLIVNLQNELNLKKELFIFIQQNAQINQNKKAPLKTEKLKQCLSKNDIEYLDELNMMKKIVETDINYFLGLYTRSLNGKAIGHLSNEGNKKVAEFIYLNYINKILKGGNHEKLFEKN